MTAQELFEFLKGVVESGNGNVRVLFDTEARTFDYHMARVGRAYLMHEEESGLPESFVSLHEERA